jgi:hypothetical protein
VETVAALYSPIYSHPFRERATPREYVLWAFEEQADAECRFGEPVVDGDRATVEWWAAITSIDGSVETIAGMSFLRFDRAARVVEQRDAWAALPGRHELDDWALIGADHLRF